ncbi:TPA: plasmid recombination protein, partial [Burkholderia vietnamiensis]|nr:plasmid recombination protein [Burkholderia vietnamiensis]HDR9236273.1 plasmid recombination protein [Burkholderia vietnamiensis]
MRVAKLRTAGAVKASGAHTWRERPTPNADHTRTDSNQDWRPVRGSSELVNAVAARVEQATERAKEPVIALEYLITAHHDAFVQGGGEVDADAYFHDALSWLEGRHGKDNVVAVNVQYDEITPHMVAYVVPLVEVAEKIRKRSVIAGVNEDGTKRREVREYKQAASVRLSAGHYQGNREKLRYLQTDFALQVGAKHGLVRGREGSLARHQTVKEYHGKLQFAEAEVTHAKAAQLAAEQRAEAM